MRSPLEVMGTDLPERQVQPRARGAPLDVIDHLIPHFLTRGLVPQSRVLPREAPKAPVHDGMIHAITGAAHPTPPSMGRSELWGGATGVLTATIRVRPQAGCGTSSPQSPTPGFLTQGRIASAAPRPPHACARMPVPHGRHRSPAFRRPQGREVPRPNGVGPLPSTRPRL